ncbi:MAG: hypothetical protein ACOC4F_00755 [bacterium]
MKTRIMACIVGLTALSTTATWGLTPQNLVRIERRVAREFPEAHVLEIERQSDWANNVVSVFVSNGRELYLDLDDRVLEIEREILDREERQISRALADDSTFPALARIYREVLEQLAESEQGSRVTPEFFYRIEYEQERGQMIVAVTFRSGAGGFGDPDRRTSQVTVYANPRNGNIIAVRQR